MRGTLSHARLLAAALVVLATGAIGASSALATSSTSSANGITVSAALSPDSVTKNDIVSERMAVTNASAAAENLSIRVIGPLSTTIPATFRVTLSPRASFSRSLSFPAGLLSPGTHTLKVIAVNNANGQSAQASATVVRLP
jgi:hypothetical protein